MKIKKNSSETSRLVPRALAMLLSSGLLLPSIICHAGAALLENDDWSQAQSLQDSSCGEARFNTGAAFILNVLKENPAYNKAQKYGHLAGGATCLSEFPEKCPISPV